MIICPACGWENEDGAGRCEGCGATVAAATGRTHGHGQVAGPPPVPAHPTPAPPPPPVSPPAVYGSGPQPAPGTAGRQPSVPRRSIPVRIAPTPVRSTHPMGAAPRPVPGGVTLPGPAEQLCRRCGRSLPGERRFCACGADLVRRHVDAVPGPQRAPSWWSEWTSHRGFRRAQRSTGGGPARFDSAVSLRTTLVRLLMILLLLAALASQLGPWGGALRQEVAARIDRVMAMAAP